MGWRCRGWHSPRAGDSLGTGVTHSSVTAEQLHSSGTHWRATGQWGGTAWVFLVSDIAQAAMDTELLRGQMDTAHTQCQHRWQQRDTGTPKPQSNPHLIQWHCTLSVLPDSFNHTHTTLSDSPAPPKPLSYSGVEILSSELQWEPKLDEHLWSQSLGRAFSLFPSWPGVPLPAQPQPCPQALPQQLRELTHKLHSLIQVYVKCLIGIVGIFVIFITGQSILQESKETPTEAANHCNFQTPAQHHPN